MISFVRGVAEEIEEDSVIVEQGGIGFRIFVPASSLNYGIKIGAPVKLYTFMNVREDSISLYGFLTKEALGIFKLLINVNGIGPKAGMGILSALTTDELMFAVLSDDVKTITKAPGIGSKTAKKLILELKDKFALEDAYEQKLARISGSTEDPAEELFDSETDAEEERAFRQAQRDAVDALIALGYSGTDALKAVRRADVPHTADVDTILKAALRKIL